MPSLLWINAAIAATAIVGLTAVLLWWRSSRRPGNRLPQEWPLMQRPVFSWEERALFRQLRAALPNHTVLAKLPLVRFCQPIERQDLRYWFELLGPIHVSFVVCANNGRALAAIDIDKPERKTSERTLAIKQAVLEACHIRYVKCRADQLPSVAELQLLVPAQGEQARPQVPGPFAGTDRRSTLAETVRAPGRTRSDERWSESGFASDSFFAPDGHDERPSEFPRSRFPQDAVAEGQTPAPQRPSTPAPAAASVVPPAPRAATMPRPATEANAPEGTIPFPGADRASRPGPDSAEQQALREELRRGIRQDLRLEIPTPARQPGAAPVSLDLRLDPMLRPPAQTNRSKAGGTSQPGEFGPNITPLHRGAPAGSTEEGGSQRGRTDAPLLRPAASRPADGQQGDQFLGRT